MYCTVQTQNEYEKPEPNDYPFLFQSGVVFKVYGDFIRDYGTHYTRAVTLGSRVVSIRSISQFDMARLVQLGIDVKGASELNLKASKVYSVILSLAIRYVDRVPYF